MKRIAVWFLLTAPLCGIAPAHMAWLASDADGHAVFWFGESPGDRTYHLPDPIAKIELRSGGDAISTETVDTDDLVGLKSADATDGRSEVFGSVVYGNYHGTTLTYHVEHLPGPVSGASDVPRVNAPMQSVVTADGDGGVEVRVLRFGVPVADADVKLLDGDGETLGGAMTDAEGRVSFAADQLAEGLNAILVRVDTPKSDANPDGPSSDYLTATFNVGEDAAMTKESDRPAPPPVGVDLNSGASIGPSGLPDLPEELTSFGAAVAGETLYVYGGHTGDAHSYSTEEQSDRLHALDLSDPDAGWRLATAGPRLQGLALVSDGRGVVRIGGFMAMNDAGEDADLRSQTSVARFDPSTGDWTDLPPLPEPRSSTDAAVIDGVVYVTGGWSLAGESDDHHWHTTAWALNLNDTDAGWRSIADPPMTRRAIGVAAHGGRLYVVGGMTDAGETTTEVRVYDPTTDAWTTIDPIPGGGMAGFGAAVGVAGDRLYVNAYDGNVHRLNDDGRSWTTVARLEPSRFFHQMVPGADGGLLIVGGANMQQGKFTEIMRLEDSPLESFDPPTAAQ